MNKKYIIISIIILIYAFITSGIMMHHELWGDEAQAWLVVRDLDICGIIRHVRTEGHPLLWYFILLPFAKLHFPVISMQIVSWSIVTIAGGILLLKSPFNMFTKISVLCSSAFLYWYPALARSYCLIPILLFLLAYLYKKQKEHPYLYVLTIALLANVHIVMLCFCSVLLLLFFADNRGKRFLYPSLTGIISILFVVFYLYGSQNENLSVQGYNQIFSPGLIFDTYKNIIFNIYGSISPVFITIFSLFCIVTIIFLFKKDKKMFFVFVAHFLYQFCIFLFVWGIIAQRAWTLILVGLFCLWVAFEKTNSLKTKSVLNTVIALTFLFSINYAVTMMFKDLFLTFSDGKNAAEFIKKNIPENAFIISNSPITTSSVSIYLPSDKWKFFYHKYNDFYTYTIWNKVAPNPTDPLPLDEMLKKYETIYVLMSGNCYYTDIKPIYTSKNNVMMAQEKYYIYKLEDKHEK